MFTYQEGLELARRWGLESEYMACIADGMSPTEALEEWDLLPPETEEEREQSVVWPLCCEAQVVLPYTSAVPWLGR